MVLSVPNDFDFRNAVCSHGFFVLAPNHWDPAAQTLHTAVTLDATAAVAVSIGEHHPDGLVVRTRGRLNAAHRRTVERAVSRMLRLEEDLSAFHARCRRTDSHGKAAETRFGRLLRSATFFEDVVKVICTCNVAWRQTVAMVDRLVDCWGVSCTTGDFKGFPRPHKLAAVSAEELRSRARVGYRAAFIHKLAAGIHEGSIDLEPLEHWKGPTEGLWTALNELPGIGAYGAANLLMLLGRYDRLAIDTEMLRFLRTRHPRRTWTPAAIRKHYQRWAPNQFLAYWFELWQDYAERHGSPEQWSPSLVRNRITEQPQPGR